jgi:hypothetical protein
VQNKQDLDTALWMVGKPEVLAEILSWKLLLVCPSSLRNRGTRQDG